MDNIIFQQKNIWHPKFVIKSVTRNAIVYNPITKKSSPPSIDLVWRSADVMNIRSDYTSTIWNTSQSQRSVSLQVARLLPQPEVQCAAATRRSHPRSMFQVTSTKTIAALLSLPPTMVVKLVVVVVVVGLSHADDSQIPHSPHCPKRPQCSVSWCTFPQAHHALIVP